MTTQRKAVVPVSAGLDSTFAAAMIRGPETPPVNNIRLLKDARHLRLRPHCQLIVWWDDGEKRYVSGYGGRFAHLFSDSHRRPLTRFDGTAIRGDLERAAPIMAKFGKGRNAQSRCTRGIDRRGGQRVPCVVPRDWCL